MKITEAWANEIGVDFCRLIADFHRVMICSARHQTVISRAAFEIVSITYHQIYAQEKKYKSFFMRWPWWKDKSVDRKSN